MRRLDGAVIDIEEADDDDECRNAHWTLNVSAEEGAADERLFGMMHDDILKDPEACDRCALP